MANLTREVVGQRFAPIQKVDDRLVMEMQAAMLRANPGSMLTWVLPGGRKTKSARLDIHLATAIDMALGDSVRPNAIGNQLYRNGLTNAAEINRVLEALQAMYIVHTSIDEPLVDVHKM